MFGWIAPTDRPPAAPPGALAIDAEAASGLRFFLRATGVALARHGEDLIARVGCLRRRGGGLLSSDDLAAGLIDLRSVDAGALTGDGLALCLRPRVSALSAYATVLSLRQLFLAPVGTGLVGGTHLTDLLPFLPARRWDEAARAQLLVLRSVLGGRTCIEGVRRIVPGVHLQWNPGGFTEWRRRSLRDLTPGHPPHRHIDAANIAALDRRMSEVVAHALAWAAPGGQTARVLLSGGMDSSLLQAWLRDLQDPATPPRTLAFSLPAADCFHPETDQALLASRLLGTTHRSVPLDPQRYVQRLIELVDQVSTPAIFTDGWPGVLAACDAAVAEGATLVLLGTGADALHGVGELKTAVLAQALAPYPRVRRALALARPLLFKAGPRGEHVYDAAAMGGGEDALRGPTSFVGLCADLDQALACLGPRAVQHVFDERRALAEALSGEPHPWVRLQMADLISVGIEGSAPLVEAGAAAGIAVAHPYLDEDAVAAILAFSPEVRFFTRRGPGRWQLKPLQVALLERRGLGLIARQPKKGTCFYDASFAWMKDGPLQPLVAAIERPDCVPARVFEALKTRPDHMLWNLLVMDLYDRRVMRGNRKAGGDAT